MARQFSIGEVVNIARNGAKDVTEEIAEAARIHYCKFVQESPFSVIYDNPLTSGIVKRALGQICDQSPPPQPPPPYEGGQCDTFYNLFVVAQLSNESGTNVIPYRNGVGTVRGAVAAIEHTLPLPYIIDIKVYFDWKADPSSYTVRVNSRSRFVEGSIGFELERVDGEPDDCGEPPPPWYPETPPPNNITNVDVDVVNADGDTNTYNVTINQDSTGHISFPAVINVNTVAVSLSVTGINIGGTTINRRSGGRGGNGSNIEEPPPKPEEEEEKDGDDSTVEILRLPGAIQESGLEGLKFVEIDVTSIPMNAKISDGNGTPKIIYAGWIEFSNSGWYYSRSFIDFNKNIYLAPEGANGYAVAIKRGYEANIVKVLEIVTENTENGSQTAR